MYRRLYLTGEFCAAPGLCLQFLNPGGFFSITESECLIGDYLAHKSAESAILTGDVFPAIPLPER